MNNTPEHEHPDFEAHDAQRAKRLGEWLEGNDRKLDEEEGFFSTLFRYRTMREERYSEEPSPEQTSRMWKRISEALRSAAPARQTPIYRLRSWRTAAAIAATFLVGAALLLFLSRTPEAVLLAEASTTTVTHTTDDGSTVTLRPHSSLYEVPVESEATVRYRLEGEGLFDIASRENRMVEVVANEGLVAVLGTRFTVRTWRERLDVYLFEGSVRLEHTPSGKQRILSPGTHASLHPGGQVEEVDFPTHEVALGWLTDEMVFEERPIEDVIAELEHHHRIHIEIPDGIQEQTLTGRILLDDPQQSLDDLAVVMGGHFEHVDERTYRFRSE